MSTAFEKQMINIQGILVIDLAIKCLLLPFVERCSGLGIMWIFFSFSAQNIFKMTTPNKTPPGADPKQLERTGTVREIGSQAVWSLSSCKPGKTKQNKNAVHNNC